MEHLIEFKVSDGESMLVEVDLSEQQIDGDVIDASVLADKALRPVKSTVMMLDQCLSGAIAATARGFTEALDSMERQPADAELTFGVKVVGEVGNVAIARSSIEGNYLVRLVWKS